MIGGEPTAEIGLPKSVTGGKSDLEIIDQDVEEVKGVKNEHREKVIKPRKEADRLRQLGLFVGELERQSTRKQDPGRAEQGDDIGVAVLSAQLTEADKERLLQQVAEIGGNRELARTILFDGMENDQFLRPGLIAVNQELFHGQGPEGEKLFEINSNIVNTCAEIFEGVDELQPLFSSEAIIPVQNGDYTLSPREIFRRQQFGQLENFPNSMATWREAAVEAALEDPNLAYYDAYDWTHEVSNKVANGEISHIFPTPYTESIKGAINLAHEKRNGLLKYIIFGEAGTGKTRLVQETNAERGKDTVVINFHRFISFEDLVGHTAITVDIGGSNNTERLNNLVSRYVDSGQSEEQFWQDMENVYDHLPEHKKREYKNVEDMVEKFDAGLGPTNPADMPGAEPRDRRGSIRDSFQKRLKAYRDMSLLGIAPEKDLQARFVQGALLYCIEQGKVPCFDEMDKAGPDGIEGMLSFLSMSPGEMWKFQGGERFIPEDFYVTATSNARNIGAMKDPILKQFSQDKKGSVDDSMNRFLADRSEQITIDPQPVKDALMIAAVNLCDTKGKLLIDAKEQVQLVNAFSYIIPKLQEADLSIPITNRVIKTICSRLVSQQKEGDNTYYKRVTDPRTGERQTVGEAVEFSILQLKGASLGPEGEATVRKVLGEYRSLIATNRIASFADDLFYTPIDEGGPTHGNYLDAVSQFEDNPLYRAISRLQSDPMRLSHPKFREFDMGLVPGVDLKDLFNKSQSLDIRRLGCGNGIVLDASSEGITMRAQVDPTDQEEAPVGEQTVVKGDYGGASILSADQLGEVFIVKKSDGQGELIVDGIKVSEVPVKDQSEFFVDPLGKHVIQLVDGKLVVGVIAARNNRLSESDMQRSEAVINIPIAEDASLLDVSADGKLILYRQGELLNLVDISQVENGDLNPVIRPIDNKDWKGGRFLGSRILVGIDEQDHIATTQSGRTTAIAVL